MQNPIYNYDEEDAIENQIYDDEENNFNKDLNKIDIFFESELNKISKISNEIKPEIFMNVESYERSKFIFSYLYKINPSCCNALYGETTYLDLNKFIKKIKEKYKSIKLITKITKAYSQESLLKLKDKFLLNFVTHYDDKLKKELIRCYSIELLYSLEFDNEVKELIDIINSMKFNVESNKKSVFIRMITVDKFGSYKITSFDISENVEPLKEINLHYGENFDKYYERLKEIINSNKKGLILFHGKPGTGKTFLIRNLIKETSKENNIFLYIPNNLVDHLTDPTLFSFLSESFYTRKSLKFIFIIEDVEEFLIKRDEYHNRGISTILNLTDGILNDILSVQIIATFNTELENIDEAVLRNGRLLARKEFNTLPKDDARKLIKYLKLEEKIEFKENMTLSDIYSKKNNIDTLLHDVKIPKEKAPLGFVV